MITVNGGSIGKILISNWKDDYFRWINTLSTSKLLEWLQTNYSIMDIDNIDNISDIDLYNESLNIDYWFIGPESFCEIFYKKNDILYVFVIIDKVNVFNHDYFDIGVNKNNCFVIDKKFIIRDLVINKII